MSSSSTPSSKRSRTIMRHKLNTIPIETLNKVKDKQRQQQKEQQYLHSTERLMRQINLYDDFLTMMLVKAPFNKLLAVTRLLIQIINFHDQTGTYQSISYSESLFSDYTPIYVADEEHERYYSFKLYYNMVFEQCVAHWSLQTQEEDPTLYRDKCTHLKMLLRSCFIIAFTHDIRIRRFVMARHKIHFELIKTRPPSAQLSDQFVNECRTLFINPFLSNQGLDIIQMVQSCIDLWINQYMIQFTPPLPLLL